MVHLDAGDYLSREGESPTSGFLIESGSVEVLLERANGDRILAVLGPGQIVGEMALVDSSPRTASVRARESTLILPITAENIAKRLNAADPILRLVLGTILERFRATIRNIGSSDSNAGMPIEQNILTDVAAMAELRLEKDLRNAIQNDDIVVSYQPIVHLADGRLAGFEALARWPHPTRGLVPPTTFVPIAEASGLSPDLARTCLAQVLRDLPAIQAQGSLRGEHIAVPRISVNISGHDLTSPRFVGDLVAFAASHPAAISHVTLELTETALVHNPGDAAQALARARALGFQIAVDDFGTGYSTLNYIRTLPVDSLKIDKSFVQGMPGCETTRSIIASTLQLSESLGLKVVGEGIETRAQLSLLQMLGCTFGQGYLFGRPEALDQTLALMNEWRSWEPMQTIAPLTCSPSS